MASSEPWLRRFSSSSLANNRFDGKRENVVPAKTSMYREISLLAVLSFLWGGSFTLIKVAVETIPPATIVTVRVTVAAAILFAIARMRGLSAPRSVPLWGAFLIQGLFQSALPFTLITWGEKHIDSGLTGVLNSTPPLFIFLITILAIRREDDFGRKMLGVSVGLAGVILIMGIEALDGLGEKVLAQLAVTGASLSYALAAIYGRRFAMTSPLITATASMSMAALLMVPISFAVDRPWTLSPSATGVAAVLALAVFSTALAMIIYFRLLRTLGSLGTTTGSYLRAGFSVLLGVMFLGEPVTWMLVTGLFLIVAGVAIVNGQIRLAARSTRPG